MTGADGKTIRIPVAAGLRDQGYHVVIAPGIRRELPALLEDFVPAERYVLVSDTTVADLYGRDVATSLASAGHRVDLLTFPPGESSKSRREWARLCDAMTALGVGRASAVLALGGGVTGDLAGFVAATYMRGLPVVQVPTTLLAMIDASVGGKTGLNTDDGKNLIGAFHPPALVVVDPEFGSTLSTVRRSEGLAEALKHGAVRNASYLADLEKRADSLLQGEPTATGWAVEQSVRIKADVVAKDERESGLREILNFGHTLGHAFEAASNYALAHGAAVAIGMVFEAALGERLGVTVAGTSQRLRSAVSLFGLRANPPAGMDAATVAAVLRRDKKSRESRPRFVLLEQLGRVATDGSEWSRIVADGLVEELISQACDGEFAD